ncbi:MAG TPA: hypothetical protein VFS39_08540 [Nitrospira sp.]|nr:hypothetical protein [Nitrospira sp.]
MHRHVRLTASWLWLPALAIVVVLPLRAAAQSSTAPPSSLPATPLSPKIDGAGPPSGCDLCWKPARERGSDITRHRRYRNPELHPRKKAIGSHRSMNGAMKSTLPRHRLEETREAVSTDPAAGPLTGGR